MTILKNGLKLVVATVISVQLLAVDAEAAKRKKKKKKATTDAASVVEANESQTKLSDMIGALYYTDFSGPSVNDLNNATPSDEGTAAEPINFYNIVQVAYKTSASSKVFGNFRFLFRPSPYDSSDYFSLLDPRVGVKFSNAVQDGGFSISPSIDLEIPVTEASLDKDRLVAPRLLLESALAFPNSRLSLGLDAYARYYILSRAPTSKDTTWNIWAGPYASYQISNPVAAKITYETDSVLTREEVAGVKGTASALRVASPALKPQAVWAITPSVEFAPYVKMFMPSGTPESISLDASLFGFEFTAVAL